MLDLTWKIFCLTGNIDAYLLMKKMEENNQDQQLTEPEVKTLAEEQLS
ncbi:MAG: YqzL family protein [Sporolactobacillus sp.]